MSPHPAIARALAWLLVGALLGAGCAFPTRSTALSPIEGTNGWSSNVAPPNLWRLTIVGANVPPHHRSGSPWDSDGLPDPFVRFYRDDTLLFESRAQQDTVSPTFNATLPKNVLFEPGARVRVELWDDDGFSPEIIGLWRGHGLPASAVPGVEARLPLDGGAQVLIHVDRPAAHRGVGISAYEARGDRFHVVEVERFSPAGRAGLEPGDDIIAIGGKSIPSVGEAAAASALSMASSRGGALSVERAGARRELELDRGVVWLFM